MGCLWKQMNTVGRLSVQYNTQAAFIIFLSSGKRRKAAFSLLIDSPFLVFALLLRSRSVSLRPHSRCGNWFERHLIGKNVCNTTLWQPSFITWKRTFHFAIMSDREYVCRSRRSLLRDCQCSIILSWCLSFFYHQGKSLDGILDTPRFFITNARVQSTGAV